MRPIQRVIACGFATAAIASASLPALSGSWSGDEVAPASTQAADAGSMRLAQADREASRTRDMRHQIAQEAADVFGFSSESNRR